MACKYLVSTIKIIPGGTEVGGPLTPQGMSVTVCRLGRDAGYTGWQSKCDGTPANGPCWYWVEEHGSSPDLKFETGRA